MWPKPPRSVQTFEIGLWNLLFLPLPIDPLRPTVQKNRFVVWNLIEDWWLVLRKDFRKPETFMCQSHSFSRTPTAS